MAIGIDITNIISEAFLVLLPAAFMPKVQTKWTLRLVVVSCFAARLAVIITLIGHILVSWKLANYADASWAYALPAIWAQAAMSASLLTACIPGMQKFLEELRPGMTSLTVTSRNQQPWSSEQGSVFGTASRTRTEIQRVDKIWELSRLGASDMHTDRSNKQRDIETESEQGLTDGDITVTTEVSCTVEA